MALGLVKFDENPMKAAPRRGAHVSKSITVRPSVRLHDDREFLRRSFLPQHVRVLFVGESPPAGGSFFYAGNSGLFRATRDAFYHAIDRCSKFDSFLDCFASLGCYLEDLVHEPINQFAGRNAGDRAQRLKARRDGEMRFAQTLVELQPLVIVVLLKAIENNVERAVAVAGCANVERHVLTYPSRWHRHRLTYHDELTNLLRQFVRRGVLLP
jgi:hypothetical protein